MRRFLVLALAFLAGSTQLVRPAAAAQVAIDPPHPSVGDSVNVVVSNGFSAGCWTVLSTNCVPPAAESLFVVVDVQYCFGAPNPNCPCTLNLVSYQRVCNFGLLPAGSYVATFFENHVNPADPKSSFVIALPFTVTGPTPALRRTWGAVKSHYR